ncbi:MAG: hypothetical protein DRJ10_00775 [Bacteroidetes bacterium]|nr:MAG: hypothetical protein DRJ10_00775 [Bacteroidota bacterium]
MSLFRNKYRIEPNRWQFWDYSAPASYFITIVVYGRMEIFGQIDNKKMILSDVGKIIADHFVEIQSYHKRIILDEWVIMPNHIHCIITLGGYDFDNRITNMGKNMDIVEKIHEFSLQSQPQPTPQRPYQNQPTNDEIKQYREKRRKMLIPKIIGKFQQQTSKQINLLNESPGTKNWQPNYHDHVIRNIEEHNRIKFYIKNNPANWTDDTFYNE